MERGEVLVGVDGSAESDAAVAWAVVGATSPPISLRWLAPTTHTAPAT